MKEIMILVAFVLTWLSGVCMGIPIGLIIDDFFHEWSAKVANWTYRKFGSERKFKV